MKKIAGIIALALFTYGCQPMTKPSTEVEPLPQDEPACFLDNDVLYQLMADEHLFITLSETDQKLMLETIQEPTRLANLLSISGSDKAALSKAKELFTQVSLFPESHCPSDQYLYLRFRHAQANLAALNKLGSTQQAVQERDRTIETLRQQIEALTQIEPAISRQREEQ